MSDISKFRHEIKNYLTVICSEIQSIEEKHPVLSKDPDWIMMKQDAVQVGKMVHFLGKETNPSELSAASLDACAIQEQKKEGKIELPKQNNPTKFEEAFLIHPLLQSLSHSWKLRYSQKGFRLTYINQTQGTLKIKGIPSEMIQIFNNLLANSYDALWEKLKMTSEGTPEGAWFPEASLILARYKNQVIIKMTDNGCGISKDNIPHVFEYGVTTKPAGHGIGLAVVEELVKKYHGYIHVRSEEGHGCNVYLSFPAVLQH